MHIILALILFGHGFAHLPGFLVFWKLEEVLRHISDKVTVHLERLLLAKETLEQMLIYARYGAKARG